MAEESIQTEAMAHCHSGNGEPEREANLTPTAERDSAALTTSALTTESGSQPLHL